MQQASLEYFRQYYPDILNDARLIADEAIARAEQLAIPEEANMPSDIPAGVQLLTFLIEERTLSF
jgi:hypothetical protein